MSRFDKYFLLKETDVADYVQEKLAYFPKDTKEIGAGNIKYIFRILDKKANQSVIVMILVILMPICFFHGVMVMLSLQIV